MDHFVLAYFVFNLMKIYNIFIYEDNKKVLVGGIYTMSSG